MKLFTLSSTLFLGLTFLGQSSFAVTDLKYCKEDVSKFCSEVKKGGGRISRCLAEHAFELSAECRKSAGLGDVGTESTQPAAPSINAPVNEALSDSQKISTPKVKPQSKSEVYQKSYTDLRAKCESEIRTWCWNVKDGDTRGSVDCLMKHHGQLGEDCTKFLSGQP